MIDIRLILKLLDVCGKQCKSKDSSALVEKRASSKCYTYKIFDLSQLSMIRQILKDFKSTLKLCISINIRNTPTLHFKCLHVLLT